MARNQNIVVINPTQDYQEWSQVVALLRQNGISTTQVGLEGLSIDCDQRFFTREWLLEEMQEMILKSDAWLSVDCDFVAIASSVRPGVVLLGPPVLPEDDSVNISLGIHSYPDAVCLALAQLMRI